MPSIGNELKGYVSTLHIIELAKKNLVTYYPGVRWMRHLLMAQIRPDRSAHSSLLAPATTANMELFGPTNAWLNFFLLGESAGLYTLKTL